MKTERSLCDELLCIGECAAGSFRSNTSAHTIEGILFLYLWGQICGLTDYQSIYDFYSCQEDFQELKSVFPIMSSLNNCPSVATMSRILQSVPHPILAAGVYHWINQILPHPEGMIHAAVDGKCMRGVKVKDGLLYNLNYCLADVGFLTYMERVGSKTNEIKSVEGTIGDYDHTQKYIFTLDAMGTQTNILWAICLAGNHFVLPVKTNQPKLNKRIRSTLIDWILNGKVDNHYTDLGKYDENSIPGITCLHSTVTYVKEDNDTATPYPTDDIVEILEDLEEGDAEDIADIEEEEELSAEMVSNVETDTKVKKIAQMLTQPLVETTIDIRNKTLVWMNYGDGYIKMIHTHGRLERRDYWIIDITPQNREEFLGESEVWRCVQSIGLAVRYRAKKKKPKASNKTALDEWSVTVSVTPYILSCKLSVKDFAYLCRGHWAIEVMHHIIDMSFLEDRCKSWKKNAPQNCSLLKKLGYNIHILERERERHIATENNQKYHAISYSTSQKRYLKHPDMLAELLNAPAETPIATNSLRIIRPLTD